LRRDPPPCDLSVLLSWLPCAPTEGTVRLLSPPLVFGVETPEGTSSSRSPRTVWTPLVVWSNPSWGCVTVTFVGGLDRLPGFLLSRAVAGLFELVRGGISTCAIFGAEFLTVFSSVRARSVLFCLERRVGTLLFVRALFWGSSVAGDLG